jgi:hypothetical protein
MPKQSACLTWIKQGECARVFERTPIRRIRPAEAAAAAGLFYAKPRDTRESRRRTAPTTTTTAADLALVAKKQEPRLTGRGSGLNARAAPIGANLEGGQRPRPTCDQRPRPAMSLHEIAPLATPSANAPVPARRHCRELAKEAFSTLTTRNRTRRVRAAARLVDAAAPDRRRGQLPAGEVSSVVTLQRARRVRAAARLVDAAAPDRRRGQLPAGEVSSVVPRLISLTFLALWKWDTSIPERSGDTSPVRSPYSIVGAVANPPNGGCPRAAQCGPVGGCGKSVHREPLRLGLDNSVCGLPARARRHFKAAWPRPCWQEVFSSPFARADAVPSMSTDSSTGSAAGFILVFLKFFQVLAIDVPHGAITALPPQCSCPSSRGGAPKFQTVRP